MAVTCPNSAMPTLSIGLAELIKSGAAMAAKNGTIISKMTPVIKNLAKLTNKHIAASDGDVSCLNDVLPNAFGDLVKQTKLEGEKLETLSSELKAILELIGSMPIAITNPLFYQAEEIEKGTGEVFTLAFDPNSCTGCGTCAAHCKNNEIAMVEQTDQEEVAMTKQFQLWEQLPDTSGETINRLIHAEEHDPFAAIMLSRNFYHSMGGSANKEGAAQRTLAHMVTATAESALQGEASKRIEQVKQLISDLTSADTERARHRASENRSIRSTKSARQDR